MTDHARSVGSDDLFPGTLFGRYEILRKIGSGGMGAVYEAVHVDLQKRFALKILHSSYSADAEHVQRFVLEARAASRLTHPNVISVSDVGVEQGRPYIVMELLEGNDLLKRLGDAGPMSVEAIVDVMLPVISAVAAAHGEDVLHRDLKPENILLARTPRGERPTLLDFGISRIGKQRNPGSRLTGAGKTVGTPDYMSIEQLGGKELDGRADQYSLGVILYQLATNTLPHTYSTLQELGKLVWKGEIEPPSKRRPGLPQAFDDLVLRAMKPRADQRFADLRELGRALWPLGSVVTQAVWVEEFGDRYVLEQRVSMPSMRAYVNIEPHDLRAFAAFDEASDQALEELIRALTVHSVEAGEVVIGQGAHAHACFLLVSGEVAVVKTIGKRRFVLNHRGAGSVFGEIALLDHVPRTASVIAETPCVIGMLSRAAFDQLCASQSEIALHFRLHLAIAGIRRLRQATRHLAKLLDRGDAPESLEELLQVQAAAREFGLPLPPEPT